MFFTIEDTNVASYADDNTPYVITDNVDRVIKSLEEASEILFKWFNDNLMRINADKNVICRLVQVIKNKNKNKVKNKNSQSC